MQPPDRPSSDRRAPSGHHRAPRPDPGGRVRLAARQGHRRGDGPPRGRERLHRAADRAPGRPAAGDLRRDQGAHARDRPVGADPQPGLLVLRPLVRGQGVRRQLPGPGARAGRLDAAPARRGRRSPTPPRCPARRCCSTSTRSPRGTSSSRWAGRASARTARCSPTRPTWSATSATRSGSRTCGTGELPRRGRRASSAARPGTGRARASTTRPSTTPGAPTRSGGTGSAPPRPTTSWSTTRPTSGSSSASAAPAATASSSSPAGSKTTTEYRFLDADAPDEGFRVFAERREGLEYSLDHAVLGGEDRLPGDCTTPPARTSSSGRHPSRPPRRRSGGP